MVLFNDRRRNRQTPAQSGGSPFAPKPGQGPKVIRTQEVKPGTVIGKKAGIPIAKKDVTTEMRAFGNAKVAQSKRPQNPKAQRYIGGHL